MPALYIACPRTELLISTGISMEASAFEHALTIFRFSELQCPYCREVHKWDKPDVVLRDATPLAGTPAE